MMNRLMLRATERLADAIVYLDVVEYQCERGEAASATSVAPLDDAEAYYEASRDALNRARLEALLAQVDSSLASDASAS